MSAQDKERPAAVCDHRAGVDSNPSDQQESVMTSINDQAAFRAAVLADEDQAAAELTAKHGRPVGECPRWCARRGAGHGWDGWSTGLPQRTHSRTLGPLVDLVSVESWTPDGVLTGPARVYVDPPPFGMNLSQAEAAALAADLLTAVGLLRLSVTP